MTNNSSLFSSETSSSSVHDRGALSSSHVDTGGCDCSEAVGVGGGLEQQQIDDTSTDIPLQQQQQHGVEPFSPMNNNDGIMSPRLPLSSPLTQRRRRPSSGGRRREEDDNINETTNHHINNNFFSSPPLLKRRAFSHDYQGGVGQYHHNQQQQQRLHNDDSASFIGVGKSLRTIPSRCEMLDNNDYSLEVEDARRHTLYSTPTRNRAASSDNVILDIRNDNNSDGDDCLLLPRYNSELARQIESVTTNNDSPPDRRMSSFTTPERPRRPHSSSSSNSNGGVNNGSYKYNYSNRDRANTCPHRPQRHSIFQLQESRQKQQQRAQGAGEDEDMEGGDEESGGQFARAREGGEESNLELDLFETPPASAIDTPQTTTSFATPLMISPERRQVRASSGGLARSSSSMRRAAASAVTSAPPSRPPPLATPTSSSARRLASGPPSSGGGTIVIPVVIPNSPQATNNSNSRRGLLQQQQSSTSITSTTTTTTTQNQAQHSCIYRINPLLMKSFMILSLYVLLAYTWNTDLSFRYKSMEINYGLSEYWHGGLLSSSHSNIGGVGRGDRIGRQPRRGKLFNDDNGNLIMNDDSQDVAKLLLMNGADASSSGDDNNTDSEDNNSALSEDDYGSNVLFMSSNLKKRRPSLSYARHPAFGMYSNSSSGRRATTRTNDPNQKKWTLSRITWGIIWLGFTIPIIEALLREVRRQLNIRFFWNVNRRRLLLQRSFRTMPSSGSGIGVGGGRVHHGSIHNL